jgi:hypothetical protein
VLISVEPCRSLLFPILQRADPGVQSAGRHFGANRISGLPFVRPNRVRVSERMRQADLRVPIRSRWVPRRYIDN